MLVAPFGWRRIADRALTPWAFSVYTFQDPRGVAVFSRFAPSIVLAPSSHGTRGSERDWFGRRAVERRCHMTHAMCFDYGFTSGCVRLTFFFLEPRVYTACLEPRREREREREQRWRPHMTVDRNDELTAMQRQRRRRGGPAAELRRAAAETSADGGARGTRRHRSQGCGLGLHHEWA